MQCCIIFGEVCYLQVYIARDLSCFVTVKRSRSISDGNVMASYFVMMLLVFRLNLHSCYVRCSQILELTPIKNFPGTRLNLLQINWWECFLVFEVLSFPSNSFGI